MKGFERVAILKEEGKRPSMCFSYIKNPLTFDLESLNFNTFIRAFSHNNLQRRYLESKLCDYFGVENGDVRIVDAYPGEVETEDDYRSFVVRIREKASEIMDNII